jgi:NMD protein affecting ribosome stability and mRNA decay
MNANELADALDWVCENHLVFIGDADFKATATMLRQQQEQINNLKQWEKRQLDLIETQQAEIEELKTCLIVEQEHNERMVEDRSKYEAFAHTGGVEAGKELAVMEVMSEHCTCYKLGYSQLNDYAKVKAK